MYQYCEYICILFNDTVITWIHINFIVFSNIALIVSIKFSLLF